MRVRFFSVNLVGPVKMSKGWTHKPALASLCCPITASKHTLFRNVGDDIIDNSYIVYSPFICKLVFFLCSASSLTPYSVPNRRGNRSAQGLTGWPRKESCLGANFDCAISLS